MKKTLACLFLRSSVIHKAKATFTVVAGKYTISGSTNRVQISQAGYTML